MTKTEFLNLKEKLIRARQDGYAAAIEDSVNVVEHNACPHPECGNFVVIRDTIKALLPKGTK